MPAQHSHDEPALQTVHRVFPMPEDLREVVKVRRAALRVTLREFLAEAIAGELPRVVAALHEALAPFDGGRRPFRAPLSEPLLNALQTAATETGVSATALLFACLGRTARRRRRHNGARQKVQRGKTRRATAASDSTQAALSEVAVA